MNQGINPLFLERIGNEFGFLDWQLGVAKVFPMTLGFIRTLYHRNGVAKLDVLHKVVKILSHYALRKSWVQYADNSKVFMCVM